MLHFVFFNCSCSHFVYFVIFRENMCVRSLGYNVGASPPQVPILKTVPGPSLHNLSCACFLMRNYYYHHHQYMLKRIHLLKIINGATEKDLGKKANFLRLDLTPSLIIIWYMIRPSDSFKCC